MPELFFLVSILRAVSIVLGWLGVFYAVLNFPAPTLFGLALVLLAVTGGGSLIASTAEERRTPYQPRGNRSTPSLGIKLTSE